MPAKGDDFDLLTAQAAIEHLSNRDVLFSPGKVFPIQTGAVSVRAMLEEVYVEVSGVEALRTVATVNKADASGVVHGSMIEDGATKYRVIKIEPVGELLELVLDKGP